MKKTVLLGVMVMAAACGGSSQAPAASSVKVVPHEQLLALLPTIPGWTAEGPAQGETDTAENVSRVQVGLSQAGGMGGLGIEIMDTTMNPNILAPLQAFISANKTSTEGDPTMPTTLTPVAVLGFPAQQEWTPGVNNGSLGILVGGRFTVRVTGNSITGPQIMRTAAEAIDLKKLAALK